MKFTMELVRNYLEGNDLEDYTIEELENNKNFMLLALRYSKDKNIYNLCSKKVKKNYDIVKYLVTEYKNDIEFISEVADNYLYRQKCAVYRLELALTMMELTKNRDPEKYAKYKWLVASYYEIEKINTECVLSLIENPEFKDDLGKGFYVLYDKFNCSEKVTNFFADKNVMTIIDGEKTSLEKTLHIDFSTPDKISPNPWGYLIGYISNYDPMLASYIETDATEELKDKLKNRLKLIIQNWDKYNSKLEAEKLKMITEAIEVFSDQNFRLNCFGYFDLYYFIGKELGLLPYFIENGILSKKDIELIQKMYKTDVDYYNKFNYDIVALNGYNKLKSQVKKIYEYGIKNEEEKVETKEKDYKEKIIELKRFSNDDSNK